jgi:hypothetical protein
MNDPRIAEISRRMTAARLDERWDSLNRSIYQRLGEFASRGIGQSSMALQAVGLLCATEARAAVQLAWQNVWRTALNLGLEPSADLPAHLKTEVRAQTDEHFSKLRAILEEHNRRIGVGLAQPYDDLAKARELVLRETDAEVDLAVASLARRAEREGVASVYQFYAPVGAVVSGSHASASVVQNIGAQERVELSAALERILEGVVGALEDVGQERRDDLVELVREAREEIDRPRPNGLRLTSVLQGIGSAVQTIASVEPAYQTLKGAAALIGVHLP